MFSFVVSSLSVRLWRMIGELILVTTWGQVSTFDIHIHYYSLNKDRISNVETLTPVDIPSVIPSKA
jgi:hypothetical protein